MVDISISIVMRNSERRCTHIIFLDIFQTLSFIDKNIFQSLSFTEKNIFPTLSFTDKLPFHLTLYKEVLL